MASIHIVEDGEHLSGIAQKFGFPSIQPILDHPENSEFKKLRPNPNTLAPGDKIFIPDLELREESGSTEQRLRFVLGLDPLELRVKVLDLSEKPLDGPCDLVVGLDRTPEEEKNHIFSAPVDKDVTDARMEFTKPVPENKAVRKFPLFVGGLHDVQEFSGQQQRLNNLGYFAGFSEKSVGQFKWAVEEFQADHLQEIGLVKPTGECGTKTQKVLVKVHGV
jgi:hypothetical protein